MGLKKLLMRFTYTVLMGFVSVVLGLTFSFAFVFGLIVILVGARV